MLLQAMQAHGQLEFAASLREGVTSADRTRGGGWMPLSCRPDPLKPGKLSFFVDGRRGRHDFTTDPWSRHAIQIEGETVPALVVRCMEGSAKHGAFLMIASARGCGSGGVPARSRDLNTRVRSLGYVGPFLQQYGKAAKLLKGRGSRLLDTVAFPGRQVGVQGLGGTFVPADVGALDTSRVPLNPAQRDAVLQLTGGMDIIVGPPGTVIFRAFHALAICVGRGAFRPLSSTSLDSYPSRETVGVPVPDISLAFLLICFPLLLSPIRHGKEHNDFPHHRFAGAPRIQSPGDVCQKPGS